MSLSRYPLKKIADLAIVGMAFVIPSGFYFLTLPLLIIVALIRIISGNWRLKLADLKEPRLFFPIALYFYLLTQFFFSQNTHEALSSLSTKLPFLLFPLLLGTFYDIDAVLIKKAEKAFLLSVCLSLLSVISYAVGDFLLTRENTAQLGDSVYNKFSSFGLTRLYYNWHPTYVAMFVNHALVIFIREYAGRLKKKKISSFIMPSLIFLLLTVSLFLLNSIIGFVAYISILVYYCAIFLGRREIDKTTSISILCLLLFFAFNFLYFNPFKIQKIDALKSRELKVTDHYDERNILTIRLAKWETHFGIIRHHLLFGTTEGDIKDIRQAAYKERNFPDLSLHNYNAHNEFVEVLAVYGITGLLLFLGMLILPVSTMEKRRPYYFFILIAAITFLTESILERQQGLQYFMFFYTLYTITTVGRTRNGTKLPA